MNNISTKAISTKLKTQCNAGLVLFICLFCITSACTAQTVPSAEPVSEIKSTVDSTAAGELILKQEVWVRASLNKVWDAYTTEAGWSQWVSPLVSIELKNGGMIRTNYNPEGTLDDDTANTLFIRNYVPHKMLTLQADISPNWPEFMKEEADNLFNVVLFDALSDEKTKITSYGMGYKNNEKYLGLMKFFIEGNEMSFRKLKEYLEK
ncbi:MAG: SRPBCC domain-containing protein [Rhodothermales bacterium]